MFVPSHIGGDKPTIDFGEVFDMQRLAQGIGIPVLEWHQVKNRSSDALDELGCWNTWEAVQDREAFPRRSVVPNYLKLGTLLPFNHLKCADQVFNSTLIRYLIYQNPVLDQSNTSLRT
jgi:hypothetical protein